MCRTIKIFARRTRNGRFDINYGKFVQFTMRCKHCEFTIKIDIKLSILCFCYLYECIDECRGLSGFMVCNHKLYKDIFIRFSRGYKCALQDRRVPVRSTMTRWILTGAAPGNAFHSIVPSLACIPH